MVAFWAAMVVLGSGLATAGATDIPPPMTAEAFRQAFNNASPVQIEIERVVTVTATAEEIEKQWAEIADKPDHPKRMELESARSLAAQPLREQITLTFGGGKWHFKSRNRQQSALDLAGDDERMWMLSQGREAVDAEGTLTIIAAGVPHPRSSSIPQLFDHKVLGMLARIGNWNIQPQVVEKSKRNADAAKTVFSISNDILSEVRIVRVGSVFESELWYMYNDELIRGWKLQYRLDERGQSWPFAFFSGSNVLHRPDDLVDSLRVSRVEPVSDAEMARLVAVPATRPKVSIIDFSTPTASAAAAVELGVPQDQFVVWKPEESVGVSPAGQTFTRLGESAPPASVAWGWWGSLLAVAAMLGGSIVVRRWVRS